MQYFKLRGNTEALKQRPQRRAKLNTVAEIPDKRELYETSLKYGGSDACDAEAAVWWSEDNKERRSRHHSSRSE